MIRRFLIFSVSFIVCLFSSCINNDLPYPVITLEILNFEVEGQNGNAIIDKNNRTVTVDLQETVDLKNVKVLKCEVTEGIESPLNSSSVIDLSKPQEYTLSLYQDYKWTIRATQTIERRFTVENQIGSSVCSEVQKQIFAYVKKDANLKRINVLELKLGPEGITVYEPALSGEVDFRNPQKVTVKYHDIVEEWTVMVKRSDSDVSTDRADAWTRVAWLYGSGTAGSDNGFEYKKNGEADWKRVKVADEDNQNSSFSVCLTGLEPETEYVCRAYSNDVYGSEITFVTGVEEQPQNNSFEYTSGTSPLLLYGEGQDMWWDTGNHGSATMNKNVTTVDTSLKQSGNQSLLLSSQFVGLAGLGKFAAGNVFAGKYLKTEGTDGILGFGRPFTSRPTKLKGYIKYNCGVVDEGGDKIANGQNDIGTVYVALTDGDGVAYDDGSKWSCIIKTKEKDRQLFDKNASNVFAYGEMILNESTQGDGLIPFEIELDYKATDRVPTRIVIVASASYYGDFFQGSTSSKMWLDDITLEYDYE